MKKAFTIWQLMLAMATAAPVLAAGMAGMRSGFDSLLATLPAGLAVGFLNGAFWYYGGGRAAYHIAKSLPEKYLNAVLIALYLCCFAATIVVTGLTMKLVWWF